MPNKEELQAAFAILDAHPFKLSKDNQPHTASFVDDNPENPVQICDSKGNPLLLMSLEDYKAAMKWKPEPHDPIQLPDGRITELAHLEATAMDELLRGCILPAHLTQGAPFEEDPTWKREHQGEFAPQEPEPPTVTRAVTLPKPLEYIHLTLQVPEGDVELHATRLKAPTFELKGPPVPPPPAKLLDPSFNTKDSK